jgi:hypothetical protein
VAVRQGTAERAAPPLRLHPLGGSRQGHLQNRRLRTGGAFVGKAKKSSGHELRQAVEVAETVLQEGHHEEDGEDAEAGLPVLLPVPLVKKLSRKKIYKFHVYRFVFTV